MIEELEQKQDWYNLSLLYRKSHMYKEEKEIIQRGLQQDYDYFSKRKEWHELPLFDRLVPRPSLNLPVKSVREDILEQTCICAGADKNCYEMLVQCLESLFATKVVSKMDIFILDAGLTDDQSHYILTNFNIKEMLKVNWPFSDIPVPNSYLNILVAKAFLPEYCKGYRYYYWCDADIWIQDENYFLDYLRYADQHHIGITALKYHENYIKVSHFSDEDLTKQYHDTVGNKAYFNSGVYCIDNTSGLFEKFQSDLYQLVKVEPNGYSCIEEICLMYTLHKNNYSKHFFEEKHNYLIYDICQAYPLPLSENNILYSPYDREIIGTIQLSWITKSFYFYPTQKRNVDLEEHRKLFTFHRLHQQHVQYDTPIEELSITDNQHVASMHYRIWPD